MLPVTIVSATRCDQANFSLHTPLGRCLQTYSVFGVKTRIFFENQRSPGACYNEAIDAAEDDEEVLVFARENVSLVDFFWVDKLMLGLSQFDMIGLAGNKRRVSRQPAWSFIDDTFTWDNRANLSGIVAYGDSFPCTLNIYGDVFQPLKLMDGMLLAARKKTFARSGARFDERFDFHFQDMDLCRQFEEKNLSMAAAPIGVIHGGAVEFGGPDWRAGYRTYIEKWRD